MRRMRILGGYMLWSCRYDRFWFLPSLFTDTQFGDISVKVPWNCLLKEERQEDLFPILHQRCQIRLVSKLKTRGGECTDLLVVRFTHTHTLMYICMSMHTCVYICSFFIIMFMQAFWLVCPIAYDIHVVPGCPLCCQFIFLGGLP